MQTVIMNRMDEKELETKRESDISQSDQEINDVLDSSKENQIEKQEPSNSTYGSAARNTVHVQHAHSFQTSVVQTSTTVLPRTISEQSRLRILTRAPAVQSMSSTPSEESNEDIPPESFGEATRVLKHQTSSKDADSESGPPSLSSSRDSSFDYTDSTGTDLNEFIMKTLKNQRDKKMLLKLEKDFLGFISDPMKVLLQYPPMTSYHRMIVHRVAAYFGLDHNVDASGKCIIVNKCPNTRFPEQRFTDLVREDSEEDPLPRLILKRQNSLSDESGPPETRNNSHSRRSMEGKKSKSIEEREEEYKKARSRIFNHGSLSSQSSASSKDGESFLPGLIDADSENEKSKSIEYSESVADKSVDMPQPAVRVLTNRSRSPEELSKLTLDVSLNLDASSSASSAALISTVTDSNLDSNPLTRTVDTTTASVEGASYIARNISGGEGRSIMVEMIPQPSPNQTGGVVWTLPENHTTYSPGQGSIFPAHETPGGQVVGPDGFQVSSTGVQQGVNPTFFFPNQPAPACPAYQNQSAPRQQTPPLQQPQGAIPTQVLPMAAPFVSPASFSVFQSPRVYNQQDLEMLSAQQNNASTNPQGAITPNTGSPSSNYQDLNNQFAGISINTAEPQDNPGLSKQRGNAAFPSTSPQTFLSGQPVQFVVYRNFSGAMAMAPVSNPGQVNPAYIYPSPTPHTYTQQGYNPQVYNQVYPQQHFNQGFPLGEQTLLTHGSGSHTPPTPSQSVSPLNSNPGFVHHMQAIPVTRPQMPTPVLNPGMLHTRIMNPYGVQGQQVVQMPTGQPLFSCTQVPYPVGQSRPSLQQPARYKAYSDKGGSKSNDVYCPESSNVRRPSLGDSPRINTSSGQNRRSSGGSGKGHGKSDAQRSQYHQHKGKYKHKKNQHKHGGDSSRKQYQSASLQSGSSSLEMENTTGYGSCVLEVYDVELNARDQNQVVDDLLQAGAKISWKEKTKQSGKTLTAKATFNSYEQAEQILMTNRNPNYKLRRCPVDIPYLESQNY